MNSADKFEEFERLWQESVDRAGQRTAWTDLPLSDQKALASQFRKEMSRYGREGHIENQMGRGLYASPKSSKHPGESPGPEPDERT
jgi:hypothetical protein